jgi:MoaA/NifB/PqqE/SkfB family radical SAM enzyme
MFYKANEIRTVHLEVTNKCNALCPQCVRSVNGAFLNPNVKLSSLDLESITSIFNQSFLTQLNEIKLCGSYGDPIAHNHLLSIIRYFKDTSPKIRLTVDTNGGLHNEVWWQELANILGDDDKVVFGIDGLEDTNHLYRVGVNWKRLEQNFKAFIHSGGNAHWHFIVFKHNQHQLEEAKSFSKAIGFKEFSYKRSGRFGEVIINDKKIIGTPVYNSNSELSHVLEPATENLNSKYEDSSFDFTLASNTSKIIQPDDMNLTENRNINNIDKNHLNSLNSEAVSCEAINDKSLYISCFGNAYPCCYTAWPIYAPYSGLIVNQIRQIVDETKAFEQINLKENSLESVLKSDFFKNIYNGLSNNSSRCLSCSFACGVGEKYRKEERAQL